MKWGGKHDDDRPTGSLARTENWPERRWFAAINLGGEPYEDRESLPSAVVRAKDATGLDDWRTRDWKHMAGPVAIVDITAAVGQLLARFCAPSTFAHPNPLPHTARAVLTVTPTGIDLRLRPRHVEPFEDEIAVVSSSLTDMLRELARVLDVGLHFADSDWQRWAEHRETFEAPTMNPDPHGPPW